MLVLRIISQQKVLVGALVINLSLWKRKGLGQNILSHLGGKKGDFLLLRILFQQKLLLGILVMAMTLILENP